MKIVTLATGLAVGYVLGARAGRDKYEQIVATARKVSNQPSVVQAQDKAKAKAKELVGTGTDAVNAKLASVTEKTEAETAENSSSSSSSSSTTTTNGVPRPPRRNKPVVATPGVVTPGVATPGIGTAPLV